MEWASNLGSERRLHCFVQDLSLVRHERAARQLVIQVEMDPPFLEKMREVIRDGLSVHLAGMERDCAREIHRADDDYAVPNDLFAGLGDGAVCALLGREVNDAR